MTTVTRMATSRVPILVTVSTLEAYLGGVGEGYHWGGWERRAQDQIYTHVLPKRLYFVQPRGSRLQAKY